MKNNQVIPYTSKPLPSFTIVKSIQSSKIKRIFSAASVPSLRSFQNQDHYKLHGGFVSYMRDVGLEDIVFLVIEPVFGNTHFLEYFRISYSKFQDTNSCHINRPMNFR